MRNSEPPFASRYHAQEGGIPMLRDIWIETLRGLARRTGGITAYPLDKGSWPWGTTKPWKLLAITKPDVWNDALEAIGIDIIPIAPRLVNPDLGGLVAYYRCEGPQYNYVLATSPTILCANTTIDIEGNEPCAF